MTYPQALKRVLAGARMQRAGWNGKGMWVCVLKSTLDYADHSYPVDPFITMKTAQGTLQPGWQPSQPDMFAEDWQDIQ